MTGPLAPGTCIRCRQWAGRLIPVWWRRSEDGVADGGLCSDCCVIHCEAEDAALARKAR